MYFKTYRICELWIRLSTYRQESTVPRFISALTNSHSAVVKKLASERKNLDMQFNFAPRLGHDGESEFCPVFYAVRCETVCTACPQPSYCVINDERRGQPGPYWHELFCYMLDMRTQFASWYFMGSNILIHRGSDYQRICLQNFICCFPFCDAPCQRRFLLEILLKKLCFL
jgi:hypothetical protein